MAATCAAEHLRAAGHTRCSAPAASSRPDRAVPGRPGRRDGCSAGELLGLDETVTGGVGEAPAGVAEVGAGLLVGDADIGRAAAGLVATPAGPEERVAVGVPVVSGAASAARMAVSSSCLAAAARRAAGAPPR